MRNEIRTVQWVRRWGVVLSVTLATGCVAAGAWADEPKPADQAPPTVQQRTVAPKTPPAVPKPAEAKKHRKVRRPAAPRKAKGGCGSAKGATGAAAAEPGAKWVCEQPVVTLEPVWRGKPLRFAFEIKNEGTANLLIKASGG